MLLLLATPAMALDLSVDTTIFGLSESWTVQDAAYGVQEPVLLEGGRTDYRVEMTLTEHEHGVQYELTVIEVRGRRGKETVLSRPTLIAQLDQPAEVMFGSGGMETDVSIKVVAR